MDKPLPLRFKNLPISDALQNVVDLLCVGKIDEAISLAHTIRHMPSACGGLARKLFLSKLYPKASPVSVDHQSSYYGPSAGVRQARSIFSTNYNSPCLLPTSPKVFNELREMLLAFLTSAATYYGVPEPSFEELSKGNTTTYTSVLLFKALAELRIADPFESVPLYSLYNFDRFSSEFGVINISNGGYVLLNFTRLGEKAVKYFADEHNFSITVEEDIPALKATINEVSQECKNLKTALESLTNAPDVIKHPINQRISFFMYVYNFLCKTYLNND